MPDQLPTTKLGKVNLLLRFFVAMTYPKPQTDVEKDFPQTSFNQPPPQRHWIWLLLAVLLIGGGLAGVWRLLTPNQSSPTTANSQPLGIKVKVSTTQIGTIKESSEFIAKLGLRSSVELKSKFPGQVTKIFVKSGDAVTTGAPIIEIQSKQEPAKISSSNTASQMALAQLENARTTLKLLQADRLSQVTELRLNQEDYEKYSNLADNGAVSRQTKDQYAYKLATAKAKLGAIDSKIQTQRTAISHQEKILTQAKANIKEQPVLHYYKITTPFIGIVANVPIKIGDVVNPNTKLATINENGLLEVNIAVPLEQVSQLRQGLPVEIINSQGKIIGNSQLSFISSKSSNGNPPSILVKAVHKNAQGELRPNQLVKARIIWNRRPGVLIPKTAVSSSAGKSFVYIAQTEKFPQGVSQFVARQKLVKLGNRIGNNQQVITGLEPNQKVIVSDLLNLKDGAPIIPEI